MRPQRRRSVRPSRVEGRRGPQSRHHVVSGVWGEPHHLHGGGGMTAPARSRNIRIRGSSSRIYTDAAGREYPSVTSVIGLLDKSDALVPWAAKAAAEYAVLHRDALAQLPAPDAITLIKNNWRQKRDQAADLGTLVHDYLDRGRRPDRLPERAYFTQAERFIEAIGLTVEATEVSVCNPEI